MELTRQNFINVVLENDILLNTSKPTSFNIGGSKIGKIISPIFFDNEEIFIFKLKQEIEKGDTVGPHTSVCRYLKTWIENFKLVDINLLWEYYLIKYLEENSINHREIEFLQFLRYEKSIKDEHTEYFRRFYYYLISRNFYLFRSQSYQAITTFIQLQIGTSDYKFPETFKGNSGSNFFVFVEIRS